MSCYHFPWRSILSNILAKHTQLQGVKCLILKAYILGGDISKQATLPACRCSLEWLCNLELLTVRKHRDKLNFLDFWTHAGSNDNWVHSTYSAKIISTSGKLALSSKAKPTAWHAWCETENWDETEMRKIHIHILWIKLELLQFFIQIRDVSEVCSDDTVTVRVKAVGIWANKNIVCKEVGSIFFFTKTTSIYRVMIATFVHYLVVRSLLSGFRWGVWTGVVLS